MILLAFGAVLWYEVIKPNDFPDPTDGRCEALARAASRVGVLDEDGVHLRDVHRCVTIEGNTNSDGGSNGHSTLRKVRTFRETDGHRFIRWAEIVRLAVAA